jgi:hypothetical protein
MKLNLKDCKSLLVNKFPEHKVNIKPKEFIENDAIVIEASETFGCLVYVNEADNNILVLGWKVNNNVGRQFKEKLIEALFGKILPALFGSAEAKKKSAFKLQVMLVLEDAYGADKVIKS